MTFDEWTAEAHRSLDAWNPDPAARPVAAPRRWLLPAVAAAAVVAAGALAVVAMPSTDTDVAVTPGTEPPASESSVPVSSVPVSSVPVEPARSSAARFDCSATDGDAGAPTAVFDESADVAEWRVDDLPFAPAAPPSPGGTADAVRGTLVEAQDEDVAGTVARSEAFVDAVAPGWMCTVWSPMIDVSDPSRPGPDVDENGIVTNRLGGMCYVPDASATPGSVWGVDPSLAATLDQVDGLTDWTVILADDGRNGQGAGRLWMELSFEADPSAGTTTDAMTAITAAVASAGTAAGVPTDCSAH